MASGPPFPPPSDPAPPSFPPAGNGQPPVDYPWLAPASLPPQPGEAVTGGSTRAALYDLRPLSTGEVLDRTFSLYRSRFLLFAGIACLSAAVQLVGQGLQLLTAHFLLARGNMLTLGLTSNLLSICVSVLFLLAFAITQAATVWAVGEVYLGRSTTVVESLRATAPRWLRYLGIALWQMGSGAWPGIVVVLVTVGVWVANGRSFGSFSLSSLLVLVFLGAIVLGVILYLRNLLAVPVTVREGLGVRASMRRSKVLSNGGKGKMFLVGLIAGALYFVTAMVLLLVVGLASLTSHRAGGNFTVVQVLTLAIGFVGYTLISPVVMIGITLVYFDQRVRQEAFDVAVLLGDEAAAPLFSVTAPPFSPAPDDVLRVETRAEMDPPPAEPPGGASGL